MDDTKIKTLRSTILSIRGKFELTAAMRIDARPEERTDDQFYKYYQKKFMSILGDLEIKLNKEKGKYYLKDSEDEMLYILIDSKNKAVKDFLSLEEPNLNIFNKADDMNKQLKTFHEFATNMKSFCEKNSIIMPNSPHRRMIYNFADVKKYNTITTMCMTMRSMKDMCERVYVALSSETADIKKITEKLDYLSEKQEEMFNSLNELLNESY